MAEPVNQAISDRLVERQLTAARVEAQQRREVWAILALLEQDLLAALRTNDPTQFALLTRRRQAVETLMVDELDPLITSRYQQIAAMLDDAMVRLARQETQAVARIVNRATGEETIEDAPSDRRLRAGVVLGLFPSATTPTDLAAPGAEWWQRQGVSLAQRLGDQLRVSVSLEESLAQLTQRLQGTRAQGFRDGLMAKAREDARRLLTTQTTNALGEARAAVAAANSTGLILIHQSVLDSHTSSICLARHGLRYTADTHEPIGHEVPYLSGVPYHPGCRSNIVPAMDGGGPIRQESVSQWLNRRDTAYQDAVLGPARARLFRASKLTPRQLLDAATGRPLTLEEIGA
jgi:hypothetical protein